MSHTIGPGMLESELSAWLQQALKKYGKYENGGVDYTNAPLAPVVMCIVTWGDKILLAKRGFGLADAEGYWSTINGFIDFDKPIAEIAAQELFEELSLKVRPANILAGSSYTLNNPEGKRQYVVFPCLLQLSEEPTIVLDREHTEFTWTTREKLSEFSMLGDLPYTIDQALALAS